MGLTAYYACMGPAVAAIRSGMCIRLGLFFNMLQKPCERASRLADNVDGRSVIVKGEGACVREERNRMQRVRLLDIHVKSAPTTPCLCHDAPCQPYTPSLYTELRTCLNGEIDRTVFVEWANERQVASHQQQRSMYGVPRPPQSEHSEW